MTRDEQDLSPNAVKDMGPETMTSDALSAEAPMGGEIAGQSEDVATGVESGAKLTAFREKLDAYRMRSRARFAPIARQNDETESEPDSGQAAEGRTEQAADRLTAANLGQSARCNPQDDADAAEIGSERFEFVLPPQAYGEPAVREKINFTVPYASLAAGMAFAAVVTSGAAIVDSGAPREDAPILRERGVSASEARRFAEIGTASVPPSRGAAPGYYLDGEALRALLSARPVKCVVEAPASPARSAGAPIDMEALRLAGSVAAGCVETIVYKANASTLLRSAPAPEGGRIEINAAFSIEGDALCHHTRGLSALVIGGEMPTERARSLETLLNASYANLGGAPICHRLQRLGEAPDGPLFRADAFVDGRRIAERTDPRPFIMKPRGAQVRPPSASPTW